MDRILSDIQIVSYTGTAIQKHIQELAKLRIDVFRAFPYLYDGSIDYENEYLQTYIQSPDVIIVIAFDGKKVIGASTGMPLAHETENVQQPWISGGYDVKDVFYFGESILLPAYRGRGIGVEFFRQRESWVASLSRFSTLTFCAVIRPANHPMRPKDYTPLDKFWTNRGFTKTENMVCQMSWQDIGQESETDKSLHFWVKRLKHTVAP